MRHPRSSQPDLRLVAANTLAGVERLRPAWEQLEWRHVEAQLDWYLAATVARPNAVRPLVAAAMRGDRAEAMLVARVECFPAVPAAGPLQRIAPVRTAVLMPGGLAGSEAGCAALMRGLARAMRDGEVDAICLRTVERDGLEHRCLRAAVPALLRAPVLSEDPHWYVDLPDSYEAYRGRLSKNLRRARRREREALERRHDGAVEMVRHPGGEPVEQLLADVEAVASRSYQRSLGVGYDAAQHAPLVRAALPLGLCRAWVLRIEGRPAAFELGWTFAGTYFGAFTAYDPAFRSEGVGGQVEQAALADLCEDPAIGVYDQGVADYAYKRRLSNRCVPDARAWAFAPRPRPLAIHAVRTGYELARAVKRRLR